MTDMRWVERKEKGNLKTINGEGWRACSQWGVCDV